MPHDLVADGFGPGAISPFVIAVDPAGDSTAAERVAGAVAEDPGIATASVVRSTPELAVVTAGPAPPGRDERTQSTLQRLRSEALPRPWTRAQRPRTSAATTPR